MFKKDSFAGTILVIFLVSLVCSIIVAGSAVSLKPKQEEQKLLDKQKNILSVAGLLKPGININEVYAKNIEARLVDLNSGDYVAQQAGFDAAEAAKNPQTSIALSANDDLAKIRRRANFAEVYLVKNDQGQVEKIVLPVYGSGLWSVMYGFMAVQPDGNTIDGITYYQHGETPGLGGEIENPNWQAQFVGKKIYDAQGQEALTVKKGGSADKEHGIDALSGATLTANGVDASFKFWFGKNGFGPFLEKLRAGELNNG
ncbi:Na(+)-translocating NADH-quinone reductase subunit C [Chelonobacter oris]|uniref:Na(+)-translocating NADH-quinone reductase subunit C n=1 Tax=Chelonobacter oris TaxID=505317 RepID=A0A0A3AM06_9PAST|nr:Na(+)-translocating NADH-quinone reductase subunit C [Chelonobacter oris]KGQ70438.1 Na(+)-translocating NADH-quinone reductase subunit C [Chelonobacter oris]MDH3000460.1 Na(+)-translocating NADH-quinone reductase subunit C [Chelonobacter oris]